MAQLVGELSINRQRIRQGLTGRNVEIGVLLSEFPDFFFGERFSGRVNGAGVEARSESFLTSGVIPIYM